jgi:probable phosphoglycerate mutase
MADQPDPRSRTLGSVPEETVTRLVLIRHGESWAMVDRIVAGHDACRGLTPRGRAQAEALRDRLIRTRELEGARALVSSLMERARETAEIIAPGLGGLDVDQRCGVCEMHPGEAEGMTWDDVERTYADVLRSGPYQAWLPGAESWAELTVRVGTDLKRLADDYAGELVVIACHGGVVEASLIVLGGLPLTRPFDLAIDYTSITEWQGRMVGDQFRWRLSRLNDAAHLLDGRSDHDT